MVIHQSVGAASSANASGDNRHPNVDPPQADKDRTFRSRPRRGPTSLKQDGRAVLGSPQNPALARVRKGGNVGNKGNVGSTGNGGSTTTTGGGLGADGGAGNCGMRCRNGVTGEEITAGGIPTTCPPGLETGDEVVLGVDAGVVLVVGAGVVFGAGAEFAFGVGDGLEAGLLGAWLGALTVERSWSVLPMKSSELYSRPSGVATMPMPT